MSTTRRGAAIAALLVPAWLLLAAATALAKGPIEARLEQAIPTDAAPGSPVRLDWTLGFTEPGGSFPGQWYPVDEGDVFVRLVAPSGRSIEASGAALGGGRYSADIRIPAGGVSRIEIGTRDPAAAETLFPLVEGKAPAVVPADDLDVAIRPLDPVADPHATVDVYVDVGLQPGVALDGRVLPESLVVFARDLDTDLANYAEATPVGGDLYRASLPLPGPGRVWIEAAIGTRASLTHVFGHSLTEVRYASAPLAPAAAGGSGRPPLPEPPLGLAGLAAGAVVLLGLALARRPPRLAG